MVRGWQRRSGSRGGCLRFGCFGVLVFGIGIGALFAFPDEIKQFIDAQIAESAAQERFERHREHVRRVVDRAGKVRGHMIWEFRDPFTSIDRALRNAASTFRSLEQEHEEPLFGTFAELAQFLRTDGWYPYIRKQEANQTLEEWSRNPIDDGWVNTDRFLSAFSTLGKGLVATDGLEASDALARAKAVGTNGRTPAEKKELIDQFVSMLQEDGWLAWIKTVKDLRSSLAAGTRTEELLEFTRRAALIKAGTELTPETVQQLRNAATDAVRRLDAGQPLPVVKKGG